MDILKCVSDKRPGHHANFLMTYRGQEEIYLWFVWIKDLSFRFIWNILLRESILHSFSVEWVWSWHVITTPPRLSNRPDSDQQLIKRKRHATLWLTGFQCSVHCFLFLKYVYFIWQNAFNLYTLQRHQTCDDIQVYLYK